MSPNRLIFEIRQDVIVMSVSGRDMAKRKLNRLIEKTQLFFFSDLFASKPFPLISLYFVMKA